MNAATESTEGRLTALEAVDETTRVATAELRARLEAIEAKLDQLLFLLRMWRLLQRGGLGIAAFAAASSSAWFYFRRDLLGH